MDLDVLKHRLHDRLIARGVSPTARAHVDHALDEAIKEIESREAHQQTYMTPEEIAAEWAKTHIGEPRQPPQSDVEQTPLQPPAVEPHETGEVHSGILTNKPRRG